MSDLRGTGARKVTNPTASAVHRVGVLLEMIKFEHTVFAMPFALTSAMVAANGLPRWSVIGWILLALAGARTAAMTFNRIVDVGIDEANPRTANRALPAKQVSVLSAWLLTAVAAALLVFAAYRLNRLALILSPAALVAVLGYSYSKRFTSLSHIWLGACLGIAPVGAWIAVTGTIVFASMVLSAAVIFWTAGFDIIYSLQDIEYDRRVGLFSLPARIGAAGALWVSRALHLCSVSCLLWFGHLCGLGLFYNAGILAVALGLAYEQSLVSATNFSRVSTAFFTVNGFVSVAVFLFACLDIYLGG